MQYISQLTEMIIFVISLDKNCSSFNSLCILSRASTRSCPFYFYSYCRALGCNFLFLYCLCLFVSIVIVIRIGRRNPLLYGFFAHCKICWIKTIVIFVSIDWRWYQCEKGKHITFCENDCLGIFKIPFICNCLQQCNCLAHTVLIVWRHYGEVDVVFFCFDFDFTPPPPFPTPTYSPFL